MLLSSWHVLCFSMGMKAAIPIWQGRVSPVFDVAERLLVVDHEDGMESGRHEEALAAARRALQLDPLSLVINQNLAQSLRRAGDYDAAISQYERTLELRSEFPPTWFSLGESLLRMRRFDEARHALGRFFELTGGASQTGSRLVDLVVEYDSTGRPGPVPPDIEDAAGDRHGRLFGIYALAGQREKTLEWLERAYERRQSGILFLKDPAYDFLRDDPRFIALMRNVNLSP